MCRKVDKAERSENNYEDMRTERYLLLDRTDPEVAALRDGPDRDDLKEVFNS